MKAIIQGFELEGTPQEFVEFLNLINESTRLTMPQDSLEKLKLLKDNWPVQPYQPILPWSPYTPQVPWWPIPPATCGNLPFAFAIGE